MSQKRLSMRSIREVPRLEYELGRSHREITEALAASIPSLHRAWPPKRPCLASPASTACAGSTGAGSTGRSAWGTSADAGSRREKCSCAASSRWITCSRIPNCHGFRPSLRRSGPSRHSASNADSCPSESTGEQPGTSGATSH